MKTKLELFLLLFFATLSTYSQNFYEFKWENGGTNYKGFLIYHNDNHMVMRVGFKNFTGAYKVAEYECKRVEYTNKDGYDIIKYDGNNAKIVYTSNETDDYGYHADNFYFISNKNNKKFSALYTDDDKNETELDTEVAYRELKKGSDITKEYVDQFYRKTHSTYKSLFTNKKTPKIKPTSNVISKITLITIGDTNDLKLKKPVTADIDTYHNFFKSVAKNLNKPFLQITYKGDDFSKNIVVNKLRAISFDENEVVILLYRGHGFRWADQNSDFPRMKFGDNFGGGSYNFKDLHDIIKSKNPSLLISIGDMCNNTEGFSPVLETIPDPMIQELRNKKLDIKKMSKLLSYRGDIISVASKPGERSYASVEHGYYTVSFMDALTWEINEYNKKAYVSWRDIISEASKRAKSKVLKKHKRTQNALTLINLN